MAQELIYKNIGIIGCGAAGGFVSVLLCKNPLFKVTAFDTKEPFSTLLPTGGGRCNLSYDEKDIKEFVKNYPRGEKFLLSVFSKFDMQKTLSLFEDLGIKTYVQQDKRIFPTSDSSKKLISDLKKHLNTSNFIYRNEKVIQVQKTNELFYIKTNAAEYNFDVIIIATGGKGNGFELAKTLGHNITETKPSLSALNIKEKYLYELSGLSFKNVEITAKLKKKKFPVCIGDILFTHNSISGPCIFKISALTAFENFSDEEPLELYIKLTDISVDDIEKKLRDNSKKTVKNIFSDFVPESYICKIMKINGIDISKQSAQLKKSEKEVLINSLLNLKLQVTGRIKGSEIVTAGGVDLNEINAKTMESKKEAGLYFVGEILNIDGYTGGFNLQNCWSTAYIAASDINNKLK